MAPRPLALVIAGVLAGVPATAGAASVQLRLGGFMPAADSNLFRDDSILYTVEKSDWDGFTIGGEFSFEPREHLELGIHVDGYDERVDTFYRDYTRPSGQEILQSLKLTLVPTGVTLRFLPRSRYATVSPYVGVGGDMIWYKYEEFGDFIDFQSPELDIVPDHFIADGWEPAVHVVGGLRVRLGHDFSVIGEARYQWADDELEDDFFPQPGQDALRLDMSGLSVVVGLSLRF